MTLDDFEEGITSFEEKVDKVLGKEPDVRQKDVRLSEKSIVELVEEKCLSCGSDNIVKNGTNPKSLERGLRIEVQRYVCNDCENDFTAPVKGYQKKHYRDKTIEDSLWMRVKGTTLRKIRDFFEWLVDIRPSHESIRQWINEIGSEYRKDKRKTKGSGIYSYDEQYLKVSGKKSYRLCLKDVVTDETVNERIIDDLTKQDIKYFIIDSLKGKDVSAIVTDGDPQYDQILKEVARKFGIDKILHQLCTFHALKNLSKAISKSVKTIKN